MREKTCGKKNEHDMHRYSVEVTKTCNGMMECGAWAHPAHDYTVTEEVLCGGVCRCAYVSYPHNPNRHPEGRRVNV